jgi:hypothetical protein
MSVTPLSVAVTFHNVWLKFWKDLMLATVFKLNQTNDYEKNSDYDISSSDDEKPERKEQSFHV